MSLRLTYVIILIGVLSILFASVAPAQTLFNTSNKDSLFGHSNSAGPLSAPVKMVQSPSGRASDIPSGPVRTLPNVSPQQD